MIQKLRRQSIADCFPYSWYDAVVVSILFLSVSLGIDFYGFKVIYPLPQLLVRRSRVPNNLSLPDVLEISQEHQGSGQRVLFSICGYSLALDAGRENFPI